MKVFITYTSVIESLTGLGLLLFPAPLISLLFGAPLEGNSGKIVAWIAGAAILSLASLTYSLRNEISAPKAVKILFFYNLLLTLIFLYGILKTELSGPGAWLVLVFHFLQSLVSVLVMGKKKIS